MTNPTAFIFARGGSKGVPRKNVRILAGKPLIAHAILAAKGCKYVSRVVVSTDDEEIAATSRDWGADVPFRRPVELARDDAPEWLAWQHALAEVDHSAVQPLDLFISVPPTSPLRISADIDACIERLLGGSFDIVVTVTPASRSPYFNMVTLDEQGAAHLVIEPKARIETRQAAPAVFDMTTVCYAARGDFVRHSRGIFEGCVGAVVVPAERALDIDTETDFQIAECLMVKVSR